MQEVVNTIRFTNRLAVIVLDAFGVSTWEKAMKQSPTINKLKSLHSIVIKSVMKTITPINFATMLTGASPETHGVTSREKPLRLETVFDVMREYNMKSGTAARATSSLGILISPNADRTGLAYSNLDIEVTQIAVSLLSEGLNLVWVQLLDIDDAGHTYGPYSIESMKAVLDTDNNLRTILEAARKNGYSVMVLADHGQHEADKGVYKGTHGTSKPEDVLVPFIWANNKELSTLLIKDN
jgi:predicted AlkP superfamily pyrophosphatase or phosphodiesterase